MFSKYFEPEKLSRLLIEEPPSADEVVHLLQMVSLDVASLSRLLLASDDELCRLEVIAEAIRRRDEMWQKRLFLMPPLYVSNGDPKRGGCLDCCLYCPWRHGNVPSDKLARMDSEDVRQEAAYLLGLGYGDIELVAATDPELLNVSNAARVVAVTREAGAQNVGINFFPLKRNDDYRALADTGCTFAIVWQETYVARVYKAMHLSGPKADIQYRLDAHDRALQGGIKTVGVAFLGGLTDWRFESLATIQHARYLQREYGANIIFGMPRWKYGLGIPLSLAPAFYGDKEYEFVGALYSLAIPESLPWFSTREHFDLSARCARGGGCMFTLDCSTEVGGYTGMHLDLFAQFPAYTRSFGKGVGWLRELGFNPQIHLPW